MAHGLGCAPDARGFREGARWDVVGPTSPTLFRKGGATGLPSQDEIELHERVVWNLTADWLELEVRLRSLDRPHARDRRSPGTWRPEALGRPRSLPKAGAYRLYELVQTAASLTDEATG